MTIPLEVQFHGVERSEAVETRIAEKVEALTRIHDRITHCRVVIEMPHHRTDKHKIFVVKVELLVPGSPPVVVTNENENDHSHSDLAVAVRDAFAAARRRVDALVDKRTAPAKHERGRRRPLANGKIGDE